MSTITVTVKPNQYSPVREVLTAACVHHVSKRGCLANAESRQAEAQKLLANHRLGSGCDCTVEEAVQAAATTQVRAEAAGEATTGATTWRAPRAAFDDGYGNPMPAARQAGSTPGLTWHAPRDASRG